MVHPAEESREWNLCMINHVAFSRTARRHQGVIVARVVRWTTVAEMFDKVFQSLRE